MVSRSQSASFRGTICPLKMSFGQAHGPSPTVAVAEFDDYQSFQIPSKIRLEIGAANWTGFLTRQTYRVNAAEGRSTHVRLEDPRTLLHDFNVFHAWNVEEDDGRVYHIMPGPHWETQQRTYIKRELDQQDFNKVQILAPNLNLLQVTGSKELLSAATILNWLCLEGNVIFTAEASAMDVLVGFYPMNLNWNTGITPAQAITELLSKLKLQWTFRGLKEVHVTLRGIGESAFIKEFLIGFGDICVTNAMEGEYGSEVNDKGRRVCLIGDRNKYEYTFPCKPNWNSAWTYQFCYDLGTQISILNGLNLTRNSRVKQLPARFHDLETWSDGRIAGAGEVAKMTRNEMSIEEYIDKICYHCYVVDFTHVANGFESIRNAYVGEIRQFDKDKLERDLSVPAQPLRKYDLTDPFNKVYNVKYPIARSLVTDSNLQCVIYALSRAMSRKGENSFENQLTLFPQINGASLDIEELISKEDDNQEYRVRLYFSKRQFFMEPNSNYTGMDKVQPDRILVTLTLEREVYTYREGVMAGVKVREIKRSIPNLCRYFKDGNTAAEEVMTLRENYQRNLGDEGVVPAVKPVLADFLAKSIADRLIQKQAIDRAGFLHFEDISGYSVDGLIDTVSTRFDAQSGIVEDVNFSTGAMDNDDLPTFAPLRISLPFDTEDDLLKDRLRNMSIAEKSLIRHAMSYLTDAANFLQTMLGPSATKHPLGADGDVPIKINKSIMQEP